MGSDFELGLGPHKCNDVTQCYKEAKKQPHPSSPVTEEVCINPELLLTHKLIGLTLI